VTTNLPLMIPKLSRVAGIGSKRVYRAPPNGGFRANCGRYSGTAESWDPTGYFSPYQMEHLKDGPKGEYLTDRLTSEAIRIMGDFSPTILEMTGQALRPKQHRDGVSLVPLLKGDPDFDRGPMIWFYPHYLPRHHAEPGSAIRIGDWKLILYYEDGRQELYNLKRDIGESDNLAKHMPEKAATMKAQLDAMLKEHGAKIPSPDPAYKKK